MNTYFSKPRERVATLVAHRVLELLDVEDGPTEEDLEEAVGLLREVTKTPRPKGMLR